MERQFRILAVNPGSTSTKLAVFDDETLIAERSIHHDRGRISGAGGLSGQQSIHKEAVVTALADMGVDPSSLSAVVGRGGLIQPIDSGTYAINDRMLKDLQETAEQHASSLSGIIAADIAKDWGIPSFVVDPVVVDEMDQYAKLTGFPGIERRSVFHALNQKAVARKVAKKLGMPYENGRFIVAHMGGGITVGAHRYGRVIDVNDALSGEGPFTPERAGTIPTVPLIRLCFSGAYTEEELIKKVQRSSGLTGYLGTNDLQKVERLIKEGDEYATLVLESMAYQVSKEIGAMAAVLEGRVDAIILTGGLAKSVRFTGCIKQRVSLIAPIEVIPGEEEMLALAQGALRVLRGEEQAKEY
ncbi:MAG: butyrate kinase [Christensenellales bacterium]|jgi:butyrate kinase